MVPISRTPFPAVTAIPPTKTINASELTWRNSRGLDLVMADEPRVVVLSPNRHIAKYALPPAHCREIGRTIVRCAYLEHYVQGIVYMLINLDRAEGRIAIREPRLPDRLEMVSELAYVMDIPIDNELLESMKARAEELLKMRDLFAHGIWMYSEPDGAWAVQLTRGNWPKVSHEKKPRHHRKNESRQRGSSSI
jgi:hypothetical protein